MKGKVDKGLFLLLCCLAVALVGASIAYRLPMFQPYIGEGRVDSINEPLIEEALEKFAPEQYEYLSSLPIVYGDVTTALATTTKYVPSGWEYITVSKEWDSSYYFTDRFKLILFVHEYLHHLEQYTDLNIADFYDDVERWYLDPSYGSSEVESNYVKHVLWWSIYGGNGVSNDFVPGREEFAYIGEQIANGGSDRLNELPSTVTDYYKGILNEALLCRER